jgi:hypothetical protein
MFNSHQSYRIIREPCEEVIELVNKELPKYKFSLNPFDNLYQIDYSTNKTDNELISPNLPIIKLYWVKHYTNSPGGEIGAIVTLGLLRDIREKFLLIGQDVSGKLFNLTGIASKTEEGKLFIENYKSDLQDWGAGILLDGLDKWGKRKEKRKNIKI